MDSDDKIVYPFGPMSEEFPVVIDDFNFAEVKGAGRNLIYSEFFYISTSSDSILL